jgi:hypothetical protein
MCSGNPDYIQYNAEGLSSGKGAGSRCCDIVNAMPDIIQKVPGTENEISSTSKYLDFFSKLDFTPCDYTRYFGGYEAGTAEADSYLRKNYQELFDSAERQRIIYNTFFVYKQGRYPSSITLGTDLVPIISGNTIKSPTGTIPLILNYYDGVHNESQYIFIVWPKGKELPILPFRYKFFYFFDLHDNECKNDYCTTHFSPSRGISFSSKGPGNNGKLLGSPPLTNFTITMIVVGIIIAVILIFSILLIVNRYRYDKKPINQKIITRV